MELSFCSWRHCPCTSLRALLIKSMGMSRYIWFCSRFFDCFISGTGIAWVQEYSYRFVSMFDMSAGVLGAATSPHKPSSFCLERSIRWLDQQGQHCLTCTWRRKCGYYGSLSWSTYCVHNFYACNIIALLHQHIAALSNLWLALCKGGRMCRDASAYKSGGGLSMQLEVAFSMSWHAAIWAGHCIVVLITSM